MTDDVIRLDDHRSTKHLEGLALCLQCQYQWHAVAPVGTAYLECPRCATSKGAWVHPCLPQAGSLYWKCDCGNTLFVLAAADIICANCALPVEGYR